MFGQVENPENENLPDLSRREIAYFMPLVVLVFAIGVLPQQVILNYLKTPTDYIVRQVERSAGQTRTVNISGAVPR
jgi:NADH:ubiquinone oxidoreductase subunit 4 (subunit M)